MFLKEKTGKKESRRIAAFYKQKGNGINPCGSNAQFYY